LCKASKLSARYHQEPDALKGPYQPDAEKTRLFHPLWQNRPQRVV
jgi:hypothetical protein